MFGSNNKDPKPQQPLPRWFMWVIFAFLAYIVVMGNLKGGDVPPVGSLGEGAEKQHTAPSADYPAIRRTFDINTWKRAMNPMHAEGLRVHDFALGKGREVRCGDEVSLLLVGRDSKGNNFDETHDETMPISFRVGGGKTYPAVEQAVMGMRVGGERTADAPPVLVYGKNGAVRDLSSLQLRLTLKSLTPDVPNDAGPLLVMAEDDKPDGARCGDTIAVSVRYWKGGKAHTHEVKALTLGARSLALGLDYVLSGMAVGETRTLALPPVYQVHEGKDSPFDGTETVIVEATRE